MKKLFFSTILLCFIIGMAGCSKKEIFITEDSVTSNTMLVKQGGKLQVATVEDFDKSYYNLNELQEFVKKNVNDYNQKAGGNYVTIDSINKKDNKVIMMLSYSGMEHYSTFNNIPAAYYAADTQNVSLELPDQYVNAKNGSPVDRATAMKDGKYKVLVVYEPYKIIVDGTVKYYSQNATLIDKKSVQSNGTDATVVIFKP